MSTLNVIAKSKRDIEELMRPFNIERIVPNIVDTHSFLNNERQRMQRHMTHINERYGSLDELKQEMAHAPAYIDYIINDIPLYLSHTKEGSDALWAFVKKQYAISESDILPDNQFLRVFNPNGKWDYYTVRSSNKKVSDLTIDHIDMSADILLPNYLWIDATDPLYSKAERYNRIMAYANEHTMYTLTYQN